MHKFEGIQVLSKLGAIVDEASMQVISGGEEFFLEGGSPWDAVLLLLLNVFAGHIGGIIQKCNESLHEFLAVLLSLNTLVDVDLLIDETLGAECLLSCLMEELLGRVILGIHLDRLRCCRHRVEIWVASTCIIHAHPVKFALIY